MQKVIITGGAGFVGSHVVEAILKKTDWEIIVLDKLTYASNGYDRLRDIDVFDEKRVKIFTPDLQEPISDGLIQEIGDVDYVINMASESHVDNSIADPVNFILNNVKLTLTMLEYARKVKPKKFIQFSTDEVYGTAPKGINYREGDRFNAGNPYSASKAAQEVICQSYANTYGIPIVITNGMNFIGERQHKEKFVPICIRKILAGKTVQIHSNPEQTKAGSRFYIHCRNAAEALLFILKETTETLDKVNASRGKFNIVGEKETDNLELAQMIAKTLGKPLKYELVNFHQSRPGHDLRYALDGSKLKNIGFNYPKTLEESLEKTIQWYIQNKNKKWLK
jgi:dTDP-glucose 4,6-dehydratase